MGRSVTSARAPERSAGREGAGQRGLAGSSLYAPSRTGPVGLRIPPLVGYMTVPVPERFEPSALAQDVVLAIVDASAADLRPHDIGFCRSHKFHLTKIVYYFLIVK